MKTNLAYTGSGCCAISHKISSGVLGLLLASLSIVVSAQSFKASLVGVVTDSNREPIPGARLTLEEKATGARLTAVTDGGRADSGDFKNRREQVQRFAV